MAKSQLLEMSHHEKKRLGLIIYYTRRAYNDKKIVIIHVITQRNIEMDNPMDIP